MPRFKVGIQLQPQATSIAALLDAAAAADAAGLDSVWTWDHFYPLYGDPDAAHFEGYTLLAAMAARTSRVQLGALVTCNSYRNPNLLADMSRTIDHISGGRFVLGIGSGWFERDYREYGYEFGTARGRLADLERDLPVIVDRIGRLTPPPMGDLPILIGGSGRKVTLRLVARHADMWNSFGPPEKFAELNDVLDEWCAEEGRDPAAIERTVAIDASEVDNWQAYLDAGAQHLIVMSSEPFAIDAASRLLSRAGD
ncbi:MAG: LLM class F420-dependent oxidoreductase [Microthrixaceae bacterium]